MKATKADLDILRALAHRIVSQVESGVKAFELVKLQFEEIAEIPNTTNVSMVEQAIPERTQKYGLAIARRDWFESWYQKLGFNLSIPTPHITDDEFEKRAELRQDLFYRPSTTAVSYEDFVASVGQGNNWTITNEEARAKIVWESTPTGYWFWTEIQSSCPRLNTPRNGFAQVDHLLSLEEYVIVWWAWKTEKNKRLDHDTQCWLRTRFGQGTLSIGECDGEVSASGDSAPKSLVIFFEFRGGRVAEVVID